MPTFTGQAIGKSVSLPRDLWDLVLSKAQREDRPYSTLVRRAIVSYIFDDVTDKRARTLVDPPALYETEAGT